MIAWQCQARQHGHAEAGFHQRQHANHVVGFPSRLARGETFDVEILADSGLDKLISEGKVAAGSRVPAELQQHVFFSAGMVAGHQSAAASRFVRFLASPAAATIVRTTGLEPVATPLPPPAPPVLGQPEQR